MRKAGRNLFFPAFAALYYEEFWPFYIRQHSKAATRVWHFIGTSFVFIILGLSMWYGKWPLVLLAPVIAYGFAWFSHFFIEGNKPATFGHPLWSLRADFRMYGLMWLGRMKRELDKAERKQRRIS